MADRAVSPGAAGSSGAAAAAVVAAGKTLLQGEVSLKESQAGGAMRRTPPISSPF